MKKALHLVAILALVTTCSNIRAQSYCAASSSGASANDKINTVTIGPSNWNNFSLAGYINNTSIVFLLTKDVAANSVTVRCNGTGYTGIAVYIDYNRDFSFDDAGELVGSGAVTGTVTFSFQVPASVLLGKTRMRVRTYDIRDHQPAPPCGTLSSGQTSDYTVDINPCTAGATYPGYETINSVQLADINNNTSAATATYMNFSSMSTNILRKETYSMNIALKNGGPDEQVVVFIDLNNDGDFFDAGETVYTSPTGTGPFNFNLTLPPNTSLGSKRMRIRLHNIQYLPNASACGNSGYGQVQDYSINVLDYCNAGSIHTDDYHPTIQKVTLGTIDHTDNAAGGSYQDFTSISTNLPKGMALNMSVTIKNPVSFATFIVYMDLNSNATFTDPGEKLYVSNGTQNVNTFHITIPESSRNGKTRMRIRMSNMQPEPDPCGLVYAGETEDYSVVLENCLSMTPILTNTTKLCPGTKTTLVAGSPSGPNGSVVNWWTGPNGTGTLAGTGPSIDVGPGTWYARLTGSCGVPVEKSITIEANTNTVSGVNACPSAAYSLRKLSTNYVHEPVTPPAPVNGFANSTTPLVRIRRATDNALLDIGYTAQGDFDTTTLKSFAGSGDAFVATWYDQGGNSFDIVQTVTTQQPMIALRGAIVRINGKPTVSFLNSSSTYLRSTSVKAISMFGNGHIGSAYAVLRASAISSSAFGYGFDNSRWQAHINSGGILYFDVGFPYQRTSFVNNESQLRSYSLLAKPSELSVYMNSNLQSSSGNVSITGTTLTQFSVGGIPAFGNYYYSGPQSELIFYPSILTDSLQEVLETNQQLYYNTNPARNFFRTASSGSWNTNATWQSSADGTNWTNVTAAPDFRSREVVIRNGHTITVTANTTIGKTTVQTGGALVVAPGVQVTSR